MVYCTKKLAIYSELSKYRLGGAAGNRTPVRKVTDYSSTSLVCPGA
jgi:hypothetical protein